MPLPYRRCQISSPNKKVGAKEPFQPTVKTPMHGGEEDGQIFFKKLYLLEKSRKVSHQVSRDFKKYIEAADYWKRFTTHTNKIRLGKGT